MPSATGDLSGSGPQQVYVWLSYHSMVQPSNYTRWYWELIYRNNGGLQWLSDAVHYWSLSGFAVAGPNYFGIPSSWAGSGDHLLGSGVFNKTHNSNGYLAAGVLTGSIVTQHSNIGSGSAGVSSGTPPRVPKPPAVPPAPVRQSSTTYDTLVFQIFSPSDNGGSAITTYNLAVYTKSGDTYNLVKSWSSGASIQSVSDLDANTEYWVQYRAVNAYGAGPWSTITAMDTAAGPPSVPLDLAAEVTDVGTVLFEWDPPTNNGGSAITKYRVEWSYASNFSTLIGSATVNAPTTSRTISGLIPGNTVYLRVRAENADTPGSYASMSLIVAAGAKVWDGTAWRTGVVKVWDGSQWKVSKVWVCTDEDPVTWTLAK